MLRLAMLGYWHVHARDYEREAREHPGTEVVAVWDDDPDRGAAAAQGIGAPSVAETREIVAAAEAAGVAFVTCLPRLSTGYAAAIRGAIERGDVGTVTHL